MQKMGKKGLDFNNNERFVRIETIIGDTKSTVIIPEGSYNKGSSNIATKKQVFWARVSIQDLISSQISLGHIFMLQESCNG